MRKRRKASESPQQGEVLLDGLFRRLGLQKQAHEWRVLAAWHEAAGAKLAAHARAERLVGNTLYVRVATAAWANELGYLKQQLLEKLCEALGGQGVKELRFTVGPLKDAPDWE